MKLITQRSSLLVIAIVMCWTCGVESNLLEGEKYMVQLTKTMIENMQYKHISGNLLPMNTFTNEINTTLYGINVLGSVKFNSGFVNRIGSAALRTNNAKYIVLDEYARIEAEFNFNNIEIFYDFTANVHNYIGTGHILFRFSEVVFMIDVESNFETTNKFVDIRFSSASSKDLDVKFYPNDAYTQIISKEMRNNVIFRQSLTHSFENWKATLQSALETAFNDMEFPAICYYCPENDL